MKKPPGMGQTVLPPGGLIHLLLSLSLVPSRKTSLNKTVGPAEKSLTKRAMKSELTTVRKKLLDARKLYSHCAGIVETDIKGKSVLTNILSEKIVGIGIAIDWLRRAAEMDAISFMGTNLNESRWVDSFLETTRFTFAWYAANALFTRDSILDLFGGPIPKNEFGRFEMLFALANLPAKTIADRESDLHAILNEATSPRLPGFSLGTSVTTLFAVDQKYVPEHARKKGTAKKISDAAASGSLVALSLPMLVYAFRNWSVHGNALYGSFGGRSKFNTYVEILLETLADVHLAAASHLKKVL